MSACTHQIYTVAADGQTVRCSACGATEVRLKQIFCIGCDEWKEPYNLAYDNACNSSCNCSNCNLLLHNPTFRMEIEWKTVQ